MTDEQTDIYEQGYTDGHKRAYLALLSTCLRELSDNPEAQGARWLKERAETILCLRALCREFGDNEWPDDLYLPDIIEKHLAKYLPR